MLRRDATKSMSFRGIFRQRNSLHVGGVFLPFLAVMLLAAPQLALAQDDVSVTVNPRSLEFFEEAPGNTGEYTVQLDADPGAETVTIMIVGGEDVVTIGNRTLELDTNNWEAGVDVTVTGVNDDDAVDERVTLTHTATIGTGDDAEELALRNVSVAVTVKDRDTQAVMISTDTLAVAEAANATYMIRLDTQPTAPVTLDIGGVSGEFAVSPSRLVFNPSGTVGLWSADQTVTVFAGEDSDAEPDTADLTHTLRGGDYTGVAGGTVTVTSTENDQRGVTVSPPTPTLNIVAGARGTFTVVLDTQPTATVTITVTEDSDDLSVDRPTLNFSTSNWNRPQTVTVRVDSDAQPGSVTMTTAVSDASNTRDMGYDGEDVDDVTVEIEERTSDVILSRSSLGIDEGKTGEYTVRLRRNPGVTVTRTVAVAVIGAGFSVDQNSLTFSGPTTEGGTDGTWNTPQAVMVTGPNDDNAVEETATITHSIEGIVPSGILRVTMDESDTRGVTVSTTSLEVTENGTAKYNIVLDSQPVGDEQDRVTVTVGGASGDVSVSPSQLVFNGTNWFTAQEVEVSAAHDDDGEPDAPVTLTHTVRGGDYERQRADSVRVTVKEIHTRGIIVDTTLDPTEDPDVATSSLTVDEGMTGEYSVRLESQPTGTVTVMVRGASGDVTVKPSRLIFTTGSWDEEQMVEVKAGQDDDAEPDPAVTLTHAAIGGGYSGVTAGMVTVTVREDDTDRKGVRISPRSMTVTEGAAAASYSVALTTEPTGTVTITLGGLVAASTQSLEVNPTSLTFNQRTWKSSQRVTVRAVEDDDATGGDVALTHAVNGGGYDGVTPSDVVVTVRDNDTARVVVSTPSIQMAQGTRRTYTVALGSKPTANVEVTISGQPTGVTVSPAPLAFTPENWSTPRLITVHAASNAEVTSDPNVPDTLSHGATGYADTPTPISLTVKDRTAPGVAINPTSLDVTEGGSGSYTVVLTSEPTATVYVNVEISGVSDDVRVSSSRLSFSTGNWNREQTVTVSLREDADAVSDGTVDLNHTTSGADEYEDTDPVAEGVQAVDVSPVRVMLMENDERGVTVSPTSLTVAAGSSGTYRVELTSEPLDAVTVTVDNPPDGVTVTGPTDDSSLVFMPASWDTAQTFTVTVAADAGTDSEQSFTLMHSVSGGDYSGLEGPTVALTIPVEGAPSPPAGLTAEAGDQSVTLTWGAPADDGGSAITRYEVSYREVDGDYSEWSTVAGGGSATSTTVGNLENGKSYEFQVRARNALAPGPAATASATLADSAPGAPANLTATAGDGQVALSWDEPADGGSQILRYQYRYAEAGVAYDDAWTTVSGAGNASSVTVTGLTNGTEYKFQVRAVNSVGDGAAAEASAMPGRAPTAPTGLTARVESETITVMWGAPADTGGSSVTGYQVRYRMNGSNWNNWMDVEGGASATSYTMTGLSNGIGHEIEVRAVNATGAGAAASVEATPMEGINFAHFANGTAGGVTITSDIVLVNVETSAVTPAIYFFNQMGEMIDADSVVDMTGDVEIAADGALTVPMGIAGRGEMTISTNGEGALVVGSVRVFGTGRLGGVLRFDIPAVGVAGVGASEPVNDAIFPARRMLGGIRTGAAIRNLGADDMIVTCMLMQGGEVMDSVPVMLPGAGHSAQFIDEMFPGANTIDFVGSVRCTAPEGGMFVGIALEMDAANGIFTTLPMVPLGSGADSGESMLNFAHFATGDFGGTATTSDLVFVNVAGSAVSPAIYFYDQMGNMIDASMVVDGMMDGVEVADGALMVTDEIPVMGEMTISTSGMVDGTVGSVRVVSDGPIGGVLRFDIPTIGVAGVGASDAVNAAIFPARRMANGINTGAAIRNLMAEPTTVTCRLMVGGQRMGEQPITLPGNGQNSEFINEMFENANTDDFEGSVHCTAPAGSTFTGVALEMDFNNRIFTTLPVVPVQ